jgi:16S rRNA (guanine966-N2)-methyltransferase
MKASSPSVRPGRPGYVRIIGGAFKRSHLPVPDLPGLRPTPDRVRQTLFDWLGADLSGWRCVDAFAGTGALGFEAASRGAEQVLMIEKSAKLCQLLQMGKDKFKAQAVQVVSGDALLKLSSLAAASVDLVFLDPPFDAALPTSSAATSASQALRLDLFDRALSAAARVALPGAWVYLESPKLWPEASLQVLGLQLHRHMKAGAVHAHLLQKSSS